MACPLATLSEKYGVYFSQGIAATLFRCGGIISEDCVYYKFAFEARGERT